MNKFVNYPIKPDSPVKMGINSEFDFYLQKNAAFVGLNV